MRKFQRYGSALLLVVAAGGVHSYFRTAIDGESFLIFYPCVFLGALIGGLGPGLLATFVAGAFEVALHARSLQSFENEPLNSYFSVLVFTGTGLLVSVYSGYFHRLRRAIAVAHDDAIAIVESNPTPLLLLTSELRVRFANRAFYETFRTGAQETEGQAFFELGEGQWNIPELRALLERALMSGEKFSGFEISVVLPGLGRRILAFNALKVNLRGSKVNNLVLSLEDRTDQQRNETELREAQRLAHLGSWSWDFRSNVVVWSEELYRIYGVPQSGPPPRYQDSPNFYTPDGLAALEKAIEEIRMYGTPFEMEIEIRRRDGSNRWILSRGEGVYNTKRELIALRGTAQDITDMKTAQRLLRESELKFRTLAEALPQIVWIARVDGWNTYLNKRWTEHTGLSLEESHGEGWIKPFHPEDRDRVWASWQDSVKSGGVFSAESRLRGADGEYRWWLTRAIALRDEGGNILNWFGTSTDIESIKRAEEALTLSEKKYRGLIENAYDGVMIIRKDGTIDFANGRLEKMFGYEAGELQNCDYQTLIRNQDRPTHENYHDQYMVMPRQRKMGQGLAIFGQRKDGSTFPLDISLTPFKANSETFVNCIARDITEQKQMDEARQSLLAREKALKEQAIAANRMKDDFLSTLSHELRTPLTTILGWSQIVMAKDTGPDLISEGLSVIAKSARAQSQLVDDLLDVSKVVSGKMTLDRKVIELVEILELALASASVVAENKGIKVEMALGVSTCKVLADPVRLQQVFWNLLTNSIKFTPKGGSILVKLSLEPPGELAKISVIDNGMGIRPDFLERIFEKFNQADSSTTRIFGGLGLGLSIVKSLVKMHQGTVEASSEGEGKGATFSISLPVATKRPSPAFGRPIIAGKFRGGDLTGINVLAVDDNADNLRLFTVMFNSMGLKPTLVDSAKRAYDLLDTLKPHILMSDISMPGEDGYSLIRKIREKEQKTGGFLPAIALTAYAGPDDIRKILEAGFSAHVAKPVDRVKLAETILDVLEAAEKGDIPPL